MFILCHFFRENVNHYCVGKTAISFGLVHIPVTLKPSVKSNDISFNLIDRQTLSRVKYEKTCVDCDGRVVKQEDIIKGYQYERGEYVFFDDADFEKLKTKKDKTIAIEKFVPLNSIDPIYYEKAYYIIPDKNAVKAYSLLSQAMQKEHRVGIARTVIGTKEHLVSLRTAGESLVLNTMHFDDEVGVAPVVTKEAVDERELDLGVLIIQSMSGDFVASDYKDEYREKVMQAIQAKIEGKEIAKPKAVKSAQIINLMDALRQTLEDTRKAN